MYREPNGVLWVGFFPRALDRLDRNTGQITHYVPHPGDENSLGKGTTVDGIYKDAAGYLWVVGGGGGIVRFDERTGHFKHYRHNPDDPNSLISDNIYTIYGDRDGQIWLGEQGGLGRFDPATDGFATYRPVPGNPASLANFVWIIYQDRSGTLWLGGWGGALIRLDDKTKTFVSYTPDSRDAHRLNGGGINTIHEDRTWNTVGGNLWRTVPVQPAKRSVLPLHGKPGPAEQHDSVHSGRSSWQTLAQHSEGYIQVRSSKGNL
jgi:streptogramin lyase